jgi:flagellar hook-associated protein 3 FlgL
MPGPVMVNSRNPLTIQADRMAGLDGQIERLGRQIALGERFTSPSEDPAAANRAALLDRIDSRLMADQRSLARANSRLALGEGAVRTANDALVRARELTILAANGTASPEDRQVIAREVSVIEQQLLDSANIRDESGRYIFAGSRNAEPAFVREADGTTRWQGVDSAAGAEAAGIDGAAPPPGPQLFGIGPGSAFESLRTLSLALAEPDPLIRKAGFDTALAGLEASGNRLLDGQSRLGAGMARLEQEGNRLATARLQTAEALSAAKGLDLTAAIAQLDALKTTLSAAQGSFVRIYDGTLFDRLG